MKMFTNNDQTAKLIELGFEKPKSIEVYRDGHYVPFVEQQLVYSIGELIEMLPENSSKSIRYVATKRAWVVDVDVLGKSRCAKCYRGVYHAELVDALYDMIVKLKEEEVI